MGNTAIIGDQGVIFRGSHYKIAVPLKVRVEGADIDYTATGSLQLQYRLVGSGATATRWDSGDGAARFETGTDYNFYLIPSTDALLGTAGDGDKDYWLEAHYIDASSTPHPVGIEGELRVSDHKSGAPA